MASNRSPGGCSTAGNAVLGVTGGSMHDRDRSQPGPRSVACEMDRSCEASDSLRKSGHEDDDRY